LSSLIFLASLDSNSFLAFFIETLACHLSQTMPVALITAADGVCHQTSAALIIGQQGRQGRRSIYPDRTNSTGKEWAFICVRASSDSSKSGTVRKKRVTFAGCLSLSTEIVTLPHTALPNTFKRASFLRSENLNCAYHDYQSNDRTLNVLSAGYSFTLIAYYPNSLSFKIVSGKCGIQRVSFFDFDSAGHRG